MDNGGETGFREDDIGGTAGDVSGTFHSDTDVGTVTSHGAEMSETLETKLQVSEGLTLNSVENLPFDDLILVLREDTRKTTGIHDHLVECTVLSTGSRTVLEDLDAVHVVAKSKPKSNLLSNGELTTSNHLTFDSKASASSMVCLVSS